MIKILSESNFLLRDVRSSEDYYKNNYLEMFSRTNISGDQIERECFSTFGQSLWNIR